MTDSELRMRLSDRLADIEARIVSACGRAGRARSEVRLIAVTKTVSARVATLLPELGVHDLGESRPQELWKKAEAVPGVRWHLIGHLQRNKLDRTIPLVSLVHSVDSERLLHSLNEFGKARGNQVDVLLEVNCSREESKGGFSPDRLLSLTDNAVSLPGVRVQGLMTMAAHFDDPEQARPTFQELKRLRDECASHTGRLFPELSMGMSNDYEGAIEEGATFIRIGTMLFEGLEHE